MAGPATNAGTITVIGQSLGRKALITYLASIIGGALVFGVIINEFLPTVWFTGMLDVVHHHHFLPAWLELGSSWILLALLIYGVISPYLNRMIQKSNKKQVEMELKYHVNGMTCNHCKASVENNLQKIEGVKSVEVDLVSKTVSVDAEGVIDSKVEHTINELGFEFGGKA
jgi:copper chaperone CopZ